MINSKITSLRQNSRNFVPYLFLYVCIAICIILSRSIGYKSPNDVPNHAISLNKGWTVFEDGEKTKENATMPYRVKNNDTHQVDLFLTLPNITFPYTILSTYKDELNFTLLLDNEVLYENKLIPTKREKSVNGASFEHIALPSDASGKELHLKYNRTNFTLQKISPEVVLHNGLETKVLFFSQNYLGFFMMSTITVLGSLLLIATIILLKKKLLYSAQFYLALFIFVTPLWVLCNTRGIQFFTSNTLLIHYLDYITFYSIPTLVWAYLWLNWHKFGNLSVIALSLNLTIFMGFLTLKLFNIADFIQFRSFFHLVILVNSFTLIYIGLKVGFSSTKSFKIFFLGFVVFAVSCVVDIIRYYLFYSASGMTIFFQLGLVLMLICLALSYAITINEKIMTQMNASLYKNLAYADKLTGLSSRLAFEEELEQLQVTMKPQDELVVVNIDVNDFKQINDTFGHLYGDNVLKVIAETLNKLFDGIAKCYRVGGDEFCVIALNHDAGQVQRLLNRLNPILQQNENHFPVTVSYGIAVYNRFLHGSINEVFESADSRMYQNKARYKTGRI